MKTLEEKGTAPKTITCAVRLDKPLYDKLVESAAFTHQTLSEVIRAGLLIQLDLNKKEELRRDIDLCSLENELSQVRKLKLEMETLLQKKKVS